jgi:uncharacterized SAM-binding protein YcdF (DUF218 family)
VAISRGSVRRASLFIFAVLVLAAALSSPWWLRLLAGYLVRTDAPAKSDAILVLAGDFTGARARKGAELCRAGFAPVVYLSGPGDMYGSYESDYELEYLRRLGYPAEPFHTAHNEAKSTLTEAQALLPTLRANGVRRLMVVTSDYHTRRAGRIYRRLAPDIEILMVGSPYAGFNAARWWHDRESRKTVFFEWSKTIAEWTGQ